MALDLARAIVDPGSDDRRLRVGRVKTYTAGALVIVVTLDGADVTMPCLKSSPAYAAGQTVQVMKDGKSTALCLGIIGTPPPPPVPPGPPPPPPVVEPTRTARTITLLPSFTGTYRAGEGWSPTFGDEVVQGDYGGYGINTGFASYGDQVAGLHADISKPYSGRLRYFRRSGGTYAAQSPTLYLATDRYRPAGLPTKTGSAWTGTAVAVGDGAEWDLPTGWVGALLAGSAGSLGSYVAGSDPYIRLTGPSSNGDAFALTLNYFA